MADKTKQKKRNLDEVDPIMLASVLNPDLAAAVEQAQQQPQAEVRPARTTRRRVTDEIMGNLKAQFEGKAPVSPWLAYPAAAAVAGTVLNPLTAAESYILGGLGGAAVDKGTKELTGKSWGNWLSDKADINPEFAAATNPGYLAGSARVAKPLFNTARALKDASRYGGILEPNAFGRFILGNLRRLSNRGQKPQLGLNVSTPQTGFNRQAIGTTPARLDGPRPQLRIAGDINPTQLFTPEEFAAYYAPAADAANSVISERSVPYLTWRDMGFGPDRTVESILGVSPYDINHVRFNDELNDYELANSINTYIDEGDNFQDVIDARDRAYEEAAFYDDEAIRRDVAEQAREFTDNPALDAPSSVEPFDWSDYDRNLGLNDIRQQQELNQELFGAPTEEYLEPTAFAKNPRTLATAAPAEQVNTLNVSDGSERGVGAYRTSEDLTTSNRGSDADADATTTYSSLRPEEVDNRIRDIAKKQIDGKALNEEEGDFLDWLETTSKYTRYKTIKDNIDEHNAIVARFKAYDKRIADGNTSGMSDENIHPVIHRGSGYYAKYRGNSLHGSIDENGYVDIEGANFFTPEGDPNKLLRETWKDLKKGDRISIADNHGALSRDSNPLFVMNLAKILTDPNSKGFKIIPTHDIGFNGLAASHYKGVALPTEFDLNYDKTSKDRIVRAYTMLRNNYIRKFGVDPFEGVDLNEAVKLNGTRGKYPGFIVEKLKLGGCVPRRTLATGGKINF